MKKTVSLMILLNLVLFCAFRTMPAPAEEEHQAYQFRKIRIEGNRGSFISYPELVNGNPGIAAKVSETILRLGCIEEYRKLMDSLTDPSRVLSVTCDCTMDFRWDDQPLNPYCSVLITYSLRDNSHITDQRYIPMTFDLKTGNLLPFDRLFTDPAHAREWIGHEIENRVAPEIAPCIKSGSLFPVPFERYFVTGQGDIVLYYEREHLEFISGFAGSVAFLYDELWNDLDTDPEGAPISLMWPSPLQHAFGNRYEPGSDMTEGLMEAAWDMSLYGMTNDIYLFTPLPEALAQCQGSIQEGPYAEGDTWIMTENAQMRGTWLITNADRSRVTGIYSVRINDSGFVTGKSKRSEWLSAVGSPAEIRTMDESAAGQYLTVPGTADVYEFSYCLSDYGSEEDESPDPAGYGPGDHIQYIFFSDEQGILYGILFRFAPVRYDALEKRGNPS